MTANGDRSFRYSTDQLGEIALKVKKARINADLTPGLHRELQFYARIFYFKRVGRIGDLLHLLTGLPKSNVDTMLRPRTQKAAALVKKLKKIEAAQATLEESTVPYERLMWATNLPAQLKTIAAGDMPPMLDNDDILALARTNSVLERRAAIMREHRDALLAEGSRSADNARQLHIEFCRVITMLFTRVAGHSLRTKDLQEILFACSAPVFPRETTKGAVAYFTKSYYRPRAGKILSTRKKSTRKK